MSDDRRHIIARSVADALRLVWQRDESGLRRGARRCVRCAKVIPRNDLFCAYCGAPQSLRGRGARG